MSWSFGVSLNMLNQWNGYTHFDSLKGKVNIISHQFKILHIIALHCDFSFCNFCFPRHLSLKYSITAFFSCLTASPYTLLATTSFHFGAFLMQEQRTPTFCLCDHFKFIVITIDTVTCPCLFWYHALPSWAMAPLPPPRIIVDSTFVQRILWCDAQIPNIWKCGWQTAISFGDLPWLSRHLSRAACIQSSNLSVWRHNDQVPFIQTQTTWKGHPSFRTPQGLVKTFIRTVPQPAFSLCSRLLPFLSFHSCYPQEHFLIKLLHANLHLTVNFLQFFLIV